MKLVCARLGKDFNSAIAELVVLRGKWVLIDPDFTNGRLGRKLAGGKTIDVHLPSVGSGGGPGESFEIGLQLIRIVGQGLQFLARQNDGAGIVGWIHVHGRRDVRNLNLLLLHRDGKLNIQTQWLVGDVSIVVLIHREPLGDDIQGVLS